MINFPQQLPTTILCDNMATKAISEDPLLHLHVKHIDIKYHFLHNQIQSNNLQISYINTRDNIANMFMKALDTKQLTKLQKNLGLT